MFIDECTFAVWWKQEQESVKLQEEALEGPWGPGAELWCPFLVMETSAWGDKAPDNQTPSPHLERKPGPFLPCPRVPQWVCLFYLLLIPEPTCKNLMLSGSLYKKQKIWAHSVCLLLPAPRSRSRLLAVSTVPHTFPFRWVPCVWAVALPPGVLG